MTIRGWKGHLQLETLNLLLGIVAAVVGIAAPALAFYKRDRRSLRYGTWTLNLVVNLRYSLLFGLELNTWEMLGDLIVTYNARSHKRISVTRIILWNGGTTLLDGADVAVSNPLRILAHHTILSTRVIKVSDRGSGLRVSNAESSSPLILFDYLEPHAGGIIEIVHTGYWRGDIRLAGSIKNHGPIRHPFLEDFSGLARLGFYLAQHPRWARRLMAIVWIPGLWGVLSMMDKGGLFDYSTFQTYALKEGDYSELIPIRYLIVIWGTAMFAYTLIRVIWLSIGRRPSRELRSFDDSWGDARVSNEELERWQKSG